MSQIKIVKGNDAPIQWRVSYQGQPLDLTGKAVTLYVINSRGPFQLKGFEVEGNVVTATYYGADQTRFGEHSLVLRLNEGRPEMSTVAVKEAFELVEWSKDQGGESGEPIKVTPIILEADVAIAQGGSGADLSDYYTKAEANATFQPKGNYQPAGDYASASELTELSVGKADKNGKYADLTAGDLYGHGESVPAEFSFRASGGKSIKDGTAYIKELQGNAVVWNQMLKKDRTLFTGNGVEVTKNGDGSYTLNGTPTQDAWILIEEEVSNTIPLSHVWLLIGCPNGGSESTYCLWDSQNAIQDVGAGQIKRIDKNSLSIRIMVRKDFECVNLIFRPRLIDLTKMFGQGNEPTTIEDFYRLLPSNIDLNAYNEGEVIPFTADGIKSVGDNAWDEEWENGTFNTTTGNKINTETTNKQIRSANPIPVVEGENYCSTKDMWVIYETSDHSIVQSPQGAGSGNSVYVTAGMKFKIPTNAAYMRFYLLASYGTTYNHDITISLYHSGWKAEVDNTYKPYWEDTLLLDSRIKEAFPNGMMPWDKVYNKDGKGYIVKGSGSVDMGDMEWVYNETFGGFVSKPQAAMQNWKGVCSKYHYAGGYATVEDKEFGYIYLDQCIVKDTSYTDAATFKADMAGTMLYYELAEPTILEYDTPFQLDYKVADFGTEEIISSEPSAPFKGRTIYQFNAVDQIRENYNEIEKIKAALAKAGITLDL